MLMLFGHQKRTTLFACLFACHSILCCSAWLLAHLTFFLCWHYPNWIVCSPSSFSFGDWTLITMFFLFRSFLCRRFVVFFFFSCVFSIAVLSFPFLSGQWRFKKNVQSRRKDEFSLSLLLFTAIASSLHCVFCFYCPCSLEHSLTHVLPFSFNFRSSKLQHSLNHIPPPSMSFLLLFHNFFLYHQ